MKKKIFFLYLCRSSAKLTFEDAQNILDKEPLKDISDSNLSSQISVDVTQLYALASELRRGRETTGIFTQMRDELKYEFEDGNTEEPITVSISSKKSVTTVVNEFLLLANTSVAQKIADHFPNHALLRRHASPYEHKIVSTFNSKERKKKVR